MSEYLGVVESYFVDYHASLGDRIDAVYAWLFSPLVYTPENWGTTPEAAAAAAAMEAVSPPVAPR